MDHEEHRYFMNLSARKSAACERRSCACGVQPEFTLTRHSLDLSDAGLPSMCSCKCRKRRDGDRLAQEALGSSCQEGPPATFQPELPGPCFPHGMVPGPREGGDGTCVCRVGPALMGRQWVMLSLVPQVRMLP